MSSLSDHEENLARAKARRRRRGVLPALSALGFAVAALCLLFGTAYVGRTLKRNHETIGAQRDTIEAQRGSIKEMRNANETLALENQNLRDLLNKKATPPAPAPPEPQPPGPKQPKPKQPKTEPQGTGPVNQPTKLETLRQIRPKPGR